MFCRNCGTELSDDDNFCFNCGNKVGEEAETTPKEEPKAVDEFDELLELDTEDFEDEGLVWEEVPIDEDLSFIEPEAEKEEVAEIVKTYRSTMNEKTLARAQEIVDKLPDCNEKNARINR